MLDQAQALQVGDRRLKVFGNRDDRCFGLQQQAQLGRSFFAATKDNHCPVRHCNKEGEGFHFAHLENLPRNVPISCQFTIWRKK